MTSELNLARYSIKSPNFPVASTPAYLWCAAGGNRQWDGCSVVVRGLQGHTGDDAERIFSGGQNSARTIKPFMLVEVVTKAVELKSLCYAGTAQETAGSRQQTDA